MPKKLLIVSIVWPEPTSSAAGSRMLQLLKCFKQEKWDITFTCTALETEHMINFDDLNIVAKKIQVNDSGFDEFIKNLQPNIVIFDRFMTEEQFGWRISTHCPEALRILNTEDLHFLRKTRKKCINENIALTYSRLAENEITKREIASIYRSDLSLLISDFEMKLLKDDFNINNELVHYLPFLLPPLEANTVNHWKTFEERQHFITIGNFRHPPNLDSIYYLKQEIWPLIKKELPTAELHIYGAYPTQKVIQLSDYKNSFIIKGRAENAHEVIGKARVCLAPLRFGAGLKGKLIDSMYCGTPNTTTPIGIEGIISEETLWSGLVSNTPIDFAKKAVELYTNKTTWLQSQFKGIKIINTRFDKQKFTQKLFDKIENIQNKGIDKHREHNFIGSMLLHHTMQSTKYMSKWIEEKNKRPKSQSS